MFYNRKWFEVSIAEFMDILNRYLHRYNEQEDQDVLRSNESVGTPKESKFGCVKSLRKRSHTQLGRSRKIFVGDFQR
jgi:hypothetical protein